ncbi:MAG: LysM domain-containing protein [Thiotrichaceae bacterium]
MDIKAKTLLAISFSALFVASCSTTNGRYTVGQQVATTDSGQKGVTHTHNGVAHTHPLPDGGLSHSHNYNSGSAANANTCAPCTGGATRAVVNVPANTGGQQNTGNTHAHNGRSHSHPLPATGTSHTHNQGQQPVVKQPAQPQGNATYYDYSGGGSTKSNYYNYGGTAKGNANANGVAHSHGAKSHTHALPASGTNHTHNQGSTSIGNTYNTYANGGAPANNNQAGGNTYTVRPKDTVFQVMRNTGVYWKTIIKLNNLQAPSYTISPGQVLRLK